MSAPGGVVLVVNAGSTGLKLHLVSEGEESRQVESIDAVDTDGLDAVAHRVVHGGSRFRDPVLIDAEVHEQIFATEPLAPLHNRPALAAIDRTRAALPGVPEVAVFDTGFHATIPAEAATYALPRDWRESGVRRYGFHGLSVAWSAERVPELLGRSAVGLRLVVCHLGGGSSVSAVRDGRSVGCTMGFSPLEGVPMATRSGSVDPGALVYLMRERGLDGEALEEALNFDSGLKGLTGGSGDMREIERDAAGGDADAELAIAVFAHRVAAAVAAMAAAAEGLDVLAFTAGIGEGSAAVRERICRRLAFLGVELDGGRNAEARPDCEIASETSGVRVLVVRSREELVAARAARALVPGAGKPGAGI
jgi:acetate kinase